MVAGFAAEQKSKFTASVFVVADIPRETESEREREITNTPRICTTVKNRIIAVGLVLHHVGKASIHACQGPAGVQVSKP